MQSNSHAVLALCMPMLMSGGKTLNGNKKLTGNILDIIGNSDMIGEC